MSQYIVFMKFGLSLYNDSTFSTHKGNSRKIK